MSDVQPQPWTLNLGGGTSTKEEEAALLSKIRAFITDLGGVWHQIETSFHGAGTVDNFPTETPKPEGPPQPESVGIPVTTPDPVVIPPDVPPATSDTPTND